MQIDRLAIHNTYKVAACRTHPLLLIINPSPREWPLRSEPFWPGLNFANQISPQCLASLKRKHRENCTA